MSFTRHRLVFTLALVTASASAMAQTTPDEPAVHHPAQQSAPSGNASTSSPEEAKAIKEIQSGAAAMRALMDQIKNSKDPAERKTLLERHHQMMVKQAQAMEHMRCRTGMSGGISEAGPGAKGGPDGSMGPGGSMGQHGGMTDEALMQCHQMMEARLNMTATLMEQMMLEQMMEHVKSE